MFGEPTRLGAKARAAIIDPANTVAVSSATIWEIEIRRALSEGSRIATVDRAFAKYDVQIVNPLR